MFESHRLQCHAYLMFQCTISHLDMNYILKIFPTFTILHSKFQKITTVTPLHSHIFKHSHLHILTLSHFHMDASLQATFAPGNICLETKFIALPSAVGKAGNGIT